MLAWLPICRLHMRFASFKRPEENIPPSSPIHLPSRSQRWG